MNTPLRSILTLAVAILVTATTGCQSANDHETADQSETRLMIAYNVLVDEETSEYEIFIMNLDGSDARNISNSPGVDWVYHSYGGKLYFVSRRDTTVKSYFLYEMNPDGSRVRRVAQFPVVDSWLSSRYNGSEFIVTSKKEGRRSFHIISENGVEQSTVLGANFYINDPAFSPDGQRVAYRSKQSDLDEIWLINVDGSDPRQLTHYPEDDSTDHEHLYHAGPPFWEPHHNVISFMSFQNGNYSIFTIDPDSGGAVQLTPDSLNQGYHCWSPDGSQIVYDCSDLNNENFDIYLMNADGSEPRQLTSDDRYEQSPVFVEVAGD